MVERMQGLRPVGGDGRVEVSALAVESGVFEGGSAPAHLDAGVGRQRFGIVYTNADGNGFALGKFSAVVPRTREVDGFGKWRRGGGPGRDQEEKGGYEGRRDAIGARHKETVRIGLFAAIIIGPEIRLEQNLAPCPKGLAEPQKPPASSTPALCVLLLIPGACRLAPNLEATRRAGLETRPTSALSPNADRRRYSALFIGRGGGFAAFPLVCGPARRPRFLESGEQDPGTTPLAAPKQTAVRGGADGVSVDPLRR